MTEEIVVKTNEGLVLIDTGYYLFNRYFATLKWYRIVTKAEVNIAELHTNEVFVNAFKTHVQTDITKFAMFPYLEKRFSPRLPQKNKKVRNKLIFCLDCKRSNIWRTQLYPQYKASRKQSTDMNMNIVGIFHDFVDEMQAKRVGGIDITKLSLEGLEADDIVYFTIKNLRPRYEQPILVITNDNDFIQMIPMNVAVVNMKGVYLAERALHKNPRVSHIMKVLLGDVSDHIKGVPCIKNNQLALMVAEMTEKERQKWISEYGSPSCTKAYKFNKKLITLSQIPKNLAQSFTEKYKFSVIKPLKD